MRVNGIGLPIICALRREELDGTDMGDHLCSENQKHLTINSRKQDD